MSGPGGPGSFSFIALHSWPPIQAPTWLTQLQWDYLHSSQHEKKNGKRTSSLSLRIFPESYIQGLFGWFKRAQLWATGDWQLHHDNVPAHASCLVQSFWWNINSWRWLSPLQPRFGSLQLLAFPKTKITFEREEISDCWRDSGKYGAGNGGWEKCMRS